MILKLYPTPEAMLLIMAAYEGSQESRREAGLRRQSMSSWAVEAVLKGLKA